MEQRNVKWNYWLKQNEWTLPDAIALIFGYELRGANLSEKCDATRTGGPPLIDPPPPEREYKQIRMAFYKAKLAIESGKLKSKYPPKKAIIKGYEKCGEVPVQRAATYVVEPEHFLKWIVAEKIPYVDELERLISKVVNEKESDYQHDVRSVREIAKRIVKENPQISFPALYRHHELTFYREKRNERWVKEKIRDIHTNVRRGRLSKKRESS